MDISNLHGDWTSVGAILRRQFPHAQIPDIGPKGQLCDQLLDQLAKGHDLTRAEVQEILEEADLCHHIQPTKSCAA